MDTKKIYLLGILFLITTSGILYAQNTLFFSTYGSTNGDEEMESLIQTGDLGLLVAGMSDAFSTNGDGDLLMLKTDVNGNIQWSKTYGGTSNDMATDVKETPDGGFIVAGWTQSFGAAGYDFWVLKTDSNGNVIWEKRFGGNGDDQAWSVSVDSDAYFIVGGTNSFGAGLTDLWAIKLDLNGNIIWQKTYGSLGHDAPPGLYSEYVAKGLIDQNGNYLISGNSDGVGHGASDIYLAKLNPLNGNIIWQYAYGDTDEESSWSFVESPTGGYYLQGNTVDPNTYEGDLWVVFVDTSGAIQWQKTFGINSTWDEALNATALSDGSIVLASYFEQGPSDWIASAIKVDLSGNFLWANQYKTGHLDWTNAVYPLNDNTLAFVGVTTDTTTWDEDLTLFKTNASGNISNCNVITAISPTITTTATNSQSINFSVNNTAVSPQSTTASVVSVTLIQNNICSELISSVNSLLNFNNTTLYPNPTQGNIVIEFNAMQSKVTSILRNQLGQEIHRKTWQNTESINLTITGNQGIYFLELFNDNGDRITVRVLKI